MIGKMIKENTFEPLCQILGNAGFSRRGSAFFRVHGEDVLHVLHYSKTEHPFHKEIVQLGLFSLYSELKPQWLTSSGCIPLYNYRYLSAPRWELERNYWEASVKTIALSEDVLSFHFHLDDITNYTIPFLDQIDSQRKIIDGIDHLEYLSRLRKPETPEEAIRWTDMNKYAPYLFEQEYENAERVIMAFLNSYQVTQLDNDLSKLDARAEALRQKALLARRGDQSEIQSYLEANFLNSQKLTHFCKRQKTGGKA